MHLLSDLTTTNPWLLLLLCIGLYQLWSRLVGPWLEPRIATWQRERAEAAEIAEVKKNPDLYRRRMEGMELARRRMQESYDVAATEKIQREAAKEEQKR